MSAAPQSAGIKAGASAVSLAEDEDVPTSLSKPEETGASKSAVKESDTGDKAEGTTEVCPYTKLYNSADGADIFAILVGVAGALGSGAMLPLFSIVFGDFINVFNDQNSDDFMEQVSKISLQFVYLAIGAGVGMFLMVSCFMWSGNRQTNRLRRRFLQSVLAQEVAFFDVHATTGGLLQGLNEDSIAVQAAISDKAGNFLHHSSTFIVGFIIAFVRGWDMALVMFGCMPFLAMVGVIVAKLGASMTARGTAAYSDASAIAQQSISQIRTVAAYNQEERAITTYGAALDKPLKGGIKDGIWTGLSIGAVQFIIMGTYAVALFYGAYRVSTGDYSGGRVTNVLFATIIGGFSLGQAAPLLQTFAKGQIAGAKMFKVIERQPQVIDGGAPVAAGANGAAAGGKKDVESGTAGAIVVMPGLGGDLKEVKGQVELQGVKFAYPARPDNIIFSNFNLVVPAGKTVALVGSSGSGKSTVVSLVERFYDPLEGRVLLDGVDIRTFTLSWLRSQVGLVSQEPTLFATSIYDNIAIGREGATEAEVYEAAKAANAHKFISHLPDGYHTQVGERGVQMSGGQKQRIAIARAILKNPKILLLDEATSALDTQSERVVQAALDRMVVGRTTVVVAHRLSTIKHADVIAVVQGGAVVEQGTHDMLLRDPTGVYTNLVKLQMQHQAEEHVQEKEALEHGLKEQDLAEAGVLEEIDEEGNPVSPKGPVASAFASASAATAAAVPPGYVPPAGGALELVVQQSSEAPPAQQQEKGQEPEKDKANPQGPPAAKKKMNEEEEKKMYEQLAKAVPMSRLLALNRDEWHYGVFGCLASAIAGAQMPAFSFTFAECIKIFFTYDSDYTKRRASFYAWMFFLIGCASMLAIAVQQFCFGVMGGHLARRVRVLLLASILKQEVGWFDKDENSSGRLTSALATEAAYIRGAVGDSAGVIIQNLTTLACGYIIAFAYDWRMTLVITGCFPMLAVAMVFQMRFLAGATSDNDRLYGSANQYITEAFASIRVIHAYNLQSFISGMYNKMLHDANALYVKQSLVGGITMGFSFFTMFILYAIVIVFGGWEIHRGMVEFEGMFKAFMAVLMAAMGMSQAAIGFPDMGKAKAAVGRVFPLIDRKPEIDSSDPNGEKPDPASIRGEIEFKAIQFAYPNRPSVIIYRDFNLHIPAGKVCALVGESGSGKSTVVSLLERFYAPDAGVITLDGIDITTYNLKHLRSLIGLVSQEPLLFSGTVADNIRYGRPDASMEELEAAAAAANAREFIEKLPEKYNTKVGEGGIQLSGGQKQRIAIARAVVKNPKIMLLDEATSALDARAERVVQDALDKIMKGRTSLVIAHRLSTIRAADSINVVYRGVILEQGTHEQLMAIPNGSYARLVAAQEKKHGA